MEIFEVTRKFGWQMKIVVNGWEFPFFDLICDFTWVMYNSGATLCHGDQSKSPTNVQISWTMQQVWHRWEVSVIKNHGCKYVRPIMSTHFPCPTCIMSSRCMSLASPKNGHTSSWYSCVLFTPSLQNLSNLFCVSWSTHKLSKESYIFQSGICWLCCSSFFLRLT